MVKREKLSQRVLPSYTAGEEVFNMVSHIAGGAVGIATLALCVIFAALHGSVYGVVGSAIYDTSVCFFKHISWFKAGFDS